MATTELKTPLCNTSSCFNIAECTKVGSCQYKSSADEWREAREEKSALAEEVLTAFRETSPPVRDFTGVVDGAGVKGSMTDTTKPPLSLIDPTFLTGLGQVLGFGAKKYAPGNWMRGMKWSEVISGQLRHLAAIQRGEDIDPESGLQHVYHLACGTMFLARFMTDPKYAGFDDRLFKDAP